MSSIVVAVFAGALFSLVLAGGGLVVGVKLGQRTTPHVYVAGLGPQAGLDRSNFHGLMAEWVEVRVRLMELALAARETQQLPNEFAVQWRREVVRLSEDICHTLDQKVRSVSHDHAPSAQSVAASDSGPAAGRSHSTTPDENGEEERVYAGSVDSNNQILELLDGLGRQQRDESLPVIRYRFNVRQPLAHAVDHGPLEPEAFSIVQCHDLSVWDIRFFVDEPEIEGMIIMGLGVPRPVKWVAARIEDSRSAYRYGRVGYLVTAKLLSSINRRDHELPQKID